MGNNAAVKRLRKEYVEIQKLIEETSGKPHSATAAPDTANTHALPFNVFPLESDFLEWHFTLAGPKDTPYDGGLYHGRIVFPPDYPFAPPNVYFSTPSGRFETNSRICLNVTSYHPEQWQPAWGARTMLLAIRDYFVVEENAIGYISRPAGERRRLAVESRAFACTKCGYCAPCSAEDVRRLLAAASSPAPLEASSGAAPAAPPAPRMVRPEVAAALLAVLACVLFHALYIR